MINNRKDSITKMKQNINLNAFDNNVVVETEKLKCIDQYLVGKTLGRGSYSKVKETFDTTTLNRHAIKIMKRRDLLRIPNGEESVEKF